MQTVRPIRVVSMALAITAAAALACNEQPSLAPITSPGSPRHDGLPGATTLSGEFGVQPTNEVNTGSFGPVTMNLNIPARSRYVIRISGTITVSRNAAAYCSVTFPGAGTYGPRGYDQELGIQVQSTSGGLIRLHYPLGRTDVLESDTLWTSVAIDFMLSRNGIIGSVNCPDGKIYPLYALSGSQTVTVNVVEVVPPNTAVLTPNPAPKMKQGSQIHSTSNVVESS